MRRLVFDGSQGGSDVGDGGEDVAAEKGDRLALRGTLGWVWTGFGPFLGLVLITLLFAFMTRDTGTFLTVYNWRMIAVQTVIVGVAALGMTVVMIAGGIDLSVGSAVALVTVVIALVVRGCSVDLPWWTEGKPVHLFDIKVPLGLGLVAGLLMGGLCGLVNGTLIARMGVVPFIITLGSLKIFRGLAKWLASSTAVYIPAESKPWWFGRLLATEPEPRWLMVAPGVWLMLLLSILLALAL
ncbi:ABC transporter permease, partial [Singulisphaera rosea]